MTEDQGFAKAMAADAAMDVTIAKSGAGWEAFVKDGPGDKTADVIGPFKTKRLADEAVKEWYLRRSVRALI